MGHKIQNTLFIQLREITMSTHIKLITNKQKQLNHHHHNVQNYTVSINIKIDVHARSIKFFFLQTYTWNMLWYSEGKIFLHHSSVIQHQKRKKAKKKNGKMVEKCWYPASDQTSFFHSLCYWPFQQHHGFWECNYNMHDYNNWIKITRISKLSRMTQLYSMRCH